MWTNALPNQWMVLRCSLWILLLSVLVLAADPLSTDNETSSDSSTATASLSRSSSASGSLSRTTSGSLSVSLSRSSGSWSLSASVSSTCSSTVSPGSATPSSSHSATLSSSNSASSSNSTSPSSTSSRSISAESESWSVSPSSSVTSSSASLSVSRSAGSLTASSSASRRNSTSSWSASLSKTFSDSFSSSRSSRSLSSSDTDTPSFSTTRTLSTSVSASDSPSASYSYGSHSRWSASRSATSSPTASSSGNSTTSTSLSATRQSRTPTQTMSASERSRSMTPSGTPSETTSGSGTTSSSRSPSGSATPSPSVTSISSATSSWSSSRSALSRSQSRSQSLTPSVTFSATNEVSSTITSASRTASWTASLVHTHSRSTTPSGPTRTLSASFSAAQSFSATWTLSPSLTPTMTRTITPPPTPTKTFSPTSSFSSSSTHTQSGRTPSHSYSAERTESVSPSFSGSPSPSSSPTDSSSPSATSSSSPSTTATPTSSDTPSWSFSISLTTTTSPSESTSHEPSQTASPTTSATVTADLSATTTTSQSSSTSETASSTADMSWSTSESLSATHSVDPSYSFSTSLSASESTTASAGTFSNQQSETNSVSNEMSNTINSLSISSTPSPTSSHTSTVSGSVTVEVSSSRTISASAETLTVERSATVTLSDSASITESDERTSTLSETEEPSKTSSKSVTETPSNERSMSLGSRSPSNTASSSPSLTASPEVSLTPSATVSSVPTTSTSLSLSDTPTLSQSPDPSRTVSLSGTSSDSESATAGHTATYQSPSLTRSLTPEPSTSVTTTDTVSRSMSHTNPSVTMTLTHHFCDDVFFENASDVFQSVIVTNREPLSTLIARPDGNESTVYYQMERVEFGQLGSLELTLHLATPLRNMYGETRSTWSPTPLVSNCRMRNFSIVDMYTIRVGLSYVSNELIGLSTTYTCSLVFRNDAFACPQLLDGGLGGNRSLLNVTAAVRIVGGEATVSFAESLVRILGTIAGILSGGAALLHQSRANSINSFASCLYSLVDPLSIGDHPLGFGFGPPVGYYLRGAVVGNACFFLMVVIVHGLVVVGLTVRCYFREYYDPMHPPPSVLGTARRTTDQSHPPDGASPERSEHGTHHHVPLSRSQFPLRHEVQYQASIARFPSASVAGAVLTYDGTCTAAVGLILHHETSYDRALGCLGLVFVSSFIVVLFLITRTFFKCGRKTLSRKYRDIDTPTEDSDDDVAELAKQKKIDRYDVYKSSAAPLAVATNPDPPSKKKKRDDGGQKKNDEDALADTPPSATKRLSFWLFSPRMKWIRLDRFPYYKGMFMSLFEDYTIAYFGCAELTVSLIIGTASGVMISEREVCNALAGLSLTCLFIFILGILYARPFINRMDLFHSLTANSFAFLGAILLFIYSRQLEPDESLANAAANLATMVSVVNVVKFLTDIFAKGKQFRQLIGIEGRERMRESKKKHLKVLKRSMSMAAGIPIDVASDATSAAGDDGGDPPSPPRPKRNHLPAAFDVSSQMNLDLNSSWAAGSDDTSLRTSRRLHHRGGSPSEDGARGAIIASISASASPAARAWALAELGIDTGTPVLLQEGESAADHPQKVSAFSPTSDDDVVGSRVPVEELHSVVGRYARPPSAAITSLEDLQERIDSHHSISSKLTQHVLMANRNRGDRRDSGVLSARRGTSAGGAPSLRSLADAMDRSSLEAEEATRGPHRRGAAALTGDEIEQFMAVEHHARTNSRWFGGIIGEDSDGAERRQLSSFIKPRPGDGKTAASHRSITPAGRQPNQTHNDEDFDDML